MRGCELGTEESEAWANDAKTRVGRVGHALEQHYLDLEVVLVDCRRDPQRLLRWHVPL